jgi:large subunit ribosomal protein L32e
MADMEKLKEHKKKAKKRQPAFVVKETHNTVRVKARWRYPRGRHSQVRQEHKGKPALVRIGYGSPRVLRGLHPSGLEPVLVKNKNDLKSINTEKQGAIFSAKLGAKKKLSLLEMANKEKITIFNVKDIPTAIQKINDKFSARKKSKEEKSKQKDKKTEEKEKRAEEKKIKEAKKEKDKENSNLEENSSDATEKSKKEQKEVEKTITKRQ